MVCYRDRTFCDKYLLCADSYGCQAKLTPEVRQAAQDANLPISQFIELPPCFKPWFTEIEK